MNRNIQTVLAEYDRLKDRGLCWFYASDLQNVRNEAIRRSGGGKDLSWDLISTALNYGAVIGYRAGKRAKHED